MSEVKKIPFQLICFLVGSEGNKSCKDKFCPPGTICSQRGPIVACIPESSTGCKNHPPCPSGQVCVEKTVPCISRSCPKTAKCAKIGTCDALQCPPSHKCEMKPKPTCVRTILSTSSAVKE
ncbi:unnamed protein product [Thelazia callipaeda]|uniref:TIL domain-containing protein n=1 Tax=Thelazia callipaeda TaxID=103827 RepID=A0A0N5CSV3_THECL|nr:unnamed protein product [Thelazia callipaeda]